MWRIRWGCPTPFPWHGVVLFLRHEERCMQNHSKQETSQYDKNEIPKIYDFRKSKLLTAFYFTALSHPRFIYIKEDLIQKINTHLWVHIFVRTNILKNESNVMRSAKGTTSRQNEKKEKIFYNHIIYRGSDNTLIPQFHVKITSFLIPKICQISLPICGPFLQRACIANRVCAALSIITVIA